MSPEDQALFLAAAAGSTPIAGGDRVTPPRPPPQIAPPEPLPPRIGLSLDPGPSGRAPGVNRAQLADLRAGRVRPEATLDLHGETVTAAIPALERFLLDAARQRRRCVLIVHGKGLHSDGVAVLRDAVHAELADRMSGLVHAFTPASPTDGGAGATYVMVRR